MQRIARHRLMERSRTFTETEAGTPTRVIRVRSKSIKISDNDADDEDDDGVDVVSKTTSRNTKATTTKKPKTTSTTRLSSSLAYARAGLPMTASAISSTSFLVEEAARTSSAMPVAQVSGSAMSKGAVTGIVAGAAAVVLALLLSGGILWYRRKRRQGSSGQMQARTDSGDVFGDGETKVTASKASRPSSFSKDEDPFSIGEKDDMSTTSSIVSLSKLEKTAHLDAEKTDPATIRTPVLPSSFPSHDSNKVQLTPSHPNYVPARPPRPHQQNLFDASPVKSIQHNLPNMTPKHASKASEAGMSTYQRNLMALTSSMAFDSPPVLQNTFRPIPRPEDSPFADMHAVNPITRKPSLARNMKKDTIVGFAESYGDLYSQSEPVPVQPLYIRSTQNDNTRPLGLAIDAVQDDHIKASPLKLDNKYGISRTPELPPTLELGMPTRSISASMQDLESALEAFDYDGRAPASKADSSSNTAPTPAHKTEVVAQSLPPILGNRAPNRALHIPDVPKRDEGKSGARSSYRITRPGAGIGVGSALVSNVMSIHSTVGDIGDMTSLQPKLTASSTSPNLSTLASVNAYLAESRSGGLSKSTSSPSLSDKRKSTIQSARKSNRISISDVESLDKSRRASILTTTTTNADLETLNGMSEHPFSLEEDARLARAISLNRINRDASPNKQRQRASSVSQVQGGGRSLRSRTSTAYGGQLPPTPQPDFMHDWRSRTMTTDSEAVFALGATMLAAFPDTPPSFPSYLRSPDLRVLPPSPSLHSSASTESNARQEGGLMSASQLAEKGFIPLSQMSLQGNKHDKHYRSPIDSIVGVFEYDDNRQGSSLGQKR